MADVKSISLNGTSYNLKDATARSSADSANTAAASASQAAATAKSVADTALNNSKTNSTNISKVASESLKVVYSAETETLEITKGIKF